MSVRLSGLLLLAVGVALLSSSHVSYSANLTDWTAPDVLSVTDETNLLIDGSRDITNFMYRFSGGMHFYRIDLRSAPVGSVAGKYASEYGVEIDGAPGGGGTNNSPYIGGSTGVNQIVDVHSTLNDLYYEAHRHNYTGPTSAYPRVDTTLIQSIGGDFDSVEGGGTILQWAAPVTVLNAGPFRFSASSHQISEWVTFDETASITVDYATIGSGQSVDSEAALAGQTNHLVFSARWGDVVFIRVASSNGVSFVPWFDLVDPTMATVGVGSLSNNVAEGAFTIGDDGTFDIRSTLLSGATGPYAVSMVRLTGYPLCGSGRDIGPTAGGEELYGKIELPGDVDSVTFAAVAGDTATVRMWESNAVAFASRIDVYSPQGSLISSVVTNGLAETLVAITTNGIYTVLCMEDASNVGNYMTRVELAGGNTTPDIDGDGALNHEELAAWTDAFSASSIFRITAAESVTPTNFFAEWTTVGGLRYRLQASSDLLNGTFTNITRSAFEETEGDVGEGEADLQQFSDELTTGPGGSPRFYRVVVMPCGTE